MVYVQYNLRLRHNQLLNKTPESSSIVLDDFDPSSEWVVETQPPTFDNEDLSWMDLDPLPQPKDLNIGRVPSGPRESSQNPILESSHVEDVDDEDSDDSII
jgi:hypothetical protein